MNMRIVRVSGGVDGYAVVFIDGEGGMHRVGDVESTRDKAIEVARQELHSGLLTAMYRDELQIKLGDSNGQGQEA